MQQKFKYFMKKVLTKKLTGCNILLESFLKETNIIKRGDNIWQEK